MIWKYSIFIIIFIIIVVIIIKESKEDFNSTISCEDLDPKCYQYEEKECTTNPKYMANNCAKRCSMCRLTDNTYNAIMNNADIVPELVKGTCIDVSEECGKYLINNPNECTNRSDWMAINCKQSCDYCDKVTNIAGTTIYTKNDVYNKQSSQTLSKATATTTQVNGGGSIYGRLSMMINGDSDQCRNVSNDIKDNIMPYAEDLINNFGKEPRWMVKPYTSEELYPIKQNIVSIINILKQNIDNLLNSCINTDNIKTELESANDQNVLEMTNMLNNLTILLRQNSINITDVLALIQTVINKYIDQISKSTDKQNVKNVLQSFSNLSNTIINILKP